MKITVIGASFLGSAWPPLACRDVGVTVLEARSVGLSSAH